MPWPIFHVMKQVAPETSTPYRIMETYWSSDGPRSRIASGAFETQEQAEAHIKNIKAVGVPNG